MYTIYFTKNIKSVILFNFFSNSYTLTEFLSKYRKKYIVIFLEISALYTFKKLVIENMWSITYSSGLRAVARLIKPFEFKTKKK